MVFDIFKEVINLIKIEPFRTLFNAGIFATLATQTVELIYRIGGKTDV